MNPCSKSSEYLRIIKDSAQKEDDLHVIEKELANLSVNDVSELNDDQKKCFWCNLYNGLVRKEMKYNNNYPTSTVEKINFFYRTKLTVAGNKYSLQKIEHSILRKGKPSFGFGYLSLPQLSATKRKFQPEEFDNRIHFMLNCGAKSCPRVKLLSEDNYDAEANSLTNAYINREVDVRENSILVPRIFLWYLGDFNGRDGVRNFIRPYLDEDVQGKKVKFDSYDWRRTENFFQSRV